MRLALALCGVIAFCATELPRLHAALAGLAEAARLLPG